MSLIDKNKHIRVYEPGDTVFDQGEVCKGIYCIRSGLMGLRRLDEGGNSVLLRLCDPGQTLGYRALLNNVDHLCTAEAVMPSAVCFVERTEVTRLLANSPELGESFFRHCISDLSKTEEAYARNITLSLKARFLHILMVFYQRFGYRDEQDIYVVEIPMQRTEIADMIGATPESISRLIRKIEAEGLAQFEGRRVGICDIDAVYREIGNTH